MTTLLNTNGPIAFLFPGQGSQAIGMGKELAEKYPIAMQTFEEADELLGYKLSQLCFEGPEDQLRLTEITQPAILTVSVAAWRVLNEKGLKPNFVAGHSLGEYSAHVAAGTFSFADAGTHRAASRQIHAGSCASRRRDDGGDSRHGTRESYRSLQGRRARRGLRTCKYQLAGTDRHLRSHCSCRTSNQTRGRTRRETGESIASQRSISLLADEAGAGSSGQGFILDRVQQAIRWSRRQCRCGFARMRLIPAAMR